MPLAQINRAIHKVHPEVTLYRGDGYHYYAFDAVDQHNVYETESVYTCYTSHVPDARWIADGIAFGAKTKAERGL